MWRNSEKDKGLSVNCEVMEVEGEAREQGVCAEVMLTCTLVGTEAVTWSKKPVSKAGASPYTVGQVAVKLCSWDH